jgi:hypothetical protein
MCSVRISSTPEKAVTLFLETSNAEITGSADHAA